LTSIEDSDHENDIYFKSAAFIIDGTKLSAKGTIEFDLASISSLMDWSAILKSALVQKHYRTKSSHPITVYYQIRMIFGDDYSSFAVTSKVQQMQIALFELITYPCYTQIRAYLKLNDASEERTRDQVQEQKQGSNKHLATQLLLPRISAGCKVCLKSGFKFIICISCICK
jgi:hypothetical protein